MDRIHPLHSSPHHASKHDRALHNVRALVERNSRDFGVAAPGEPPIAIRSIGIIGAGMMGTSIAAAEAKAGLPVVITDADPKALATAANRIAANLSGGGEFQAQQQTAKLVTVTDDPAAMGKCDLVIETIAENLAAKVQLFSQIENQLGENALLASNTSTIPIGRLAAGLNDPGRFCGFHFCHPVHERPLVEIIRGPKTSDECVAAAVAHAKSIGRFPIVIQDGPGFLINRLLLPFVSEAMELLLEGVSVEQVEQAARDFGWAKGPLQMLDEIGLRTTLQGGLILWEAFPERVAASPLLVALVKAGRTGRECGAGFFSYQSSAHEHNAANGFANHRAANGANGTNGDGHNGPPISTDDQLSKIIAQWAHPRQEHTEHSITSRLLLPMVLEATRILEENKVRDPRDIDLAVLFGLGFPQARGGLLWWADTLGAARIIEMLRPMQRLGHRAEPTPLLRELARKGGHFY
jgi:3-hydroxyacyl-CoA dehydrogenase